MSLTLSSKSLALTLTLPVKVLVLPSVLFTPLLLQQESAADATVRARQSGHLGNMFEVAVIEC